MSTNDLAISSELKVEHGSAEHGPGEVRDAAQLASGKKTRKIQQRNRRQCIYILCLYTQAKKEKIQALH